LEVLNSQGGAWMSKPQRSVAEPGRFVSRGGQCGSPGRSAGSGWSRFGEQRWGPRATSCTARSTATSAVAAMAQATYEARFTSCSSGNRNTPPGAAALHRGTATSMGGSRMVSFDHFAKNKHHPLPPFLGLEPTKTKGGGSHMISQPGSSSGGVARVLSTAGRVTVAPPPSSSQRPRWAQLGDASKHRSRSTGRT